MNYDRLLNVAKALEESPVPEAFTMERWGHISLGNPDCGTPACAWGHYAARRDLQSDFLLDGNGQIRNAADGQIIHSPWTAIREHLRIEYGDVAELFDGGEPCDCDVESDDDEIEHDEDCSYAAGGCGGAKTALEAAAYIRAFVARHQARDTETQ